MRGCVIGDENTNNLRYGDDTVLLAESEEELQFLVDEVGKKSGVKGLRMNVKKTKTMVVTRGDEVKISFKINGKILEQVKSFKYLGQIITDDGKCDTEVKSRIAMARNTFAKLKDVNARILKLDLRKRIVKCYVISTLLYGAGTCTSTNEMNGFEYGKALAPR